MEEGNKEIEQYRKEKEAMLSARTDQSSVSDDRIKALEAELSEVKAKCEAVEKEKGACQQSLESAEAVNKQKHEEFDKFKQVGNFVTIALSCVNLMLTSYSEVCEF